MRELLAFWFAVFVLATFTVWALPAKCAYCPNFPCYQSSDCGSGCGCAKGNGKIQGICMSVD